MRLAIISDIHGNIEALETVLKEIERLGVDQIICAGDVVDPLPGSERVCARLTALQIPILRGNHEDYVISAVEEPSGLIAKAPNWLPVRWLAQHLPPERVEQFKSWPLTHSLHDPRAGELLICHASPRSNRIGWKTGVSDELALELESVSAPTILCAHWHLQRTEKWRDKTLIMNGSVGVPLNKKFAAEFAILESSSGVWEVEHRAVDYNAQVTWQEYIDSGWLEAGGPMAWLLFDELRTAQRRMGRYFEWFRDTNWLAETGISTDLMGGLRIAVRAFLEDMDSWEDLIRLAPFVARQMELEE